MKKILLFVFITLFTAFQAQNVSFYDLSLKNKILNSGPGNQIAKNLSGNFFAIDANSDGQISTAEANQVSYLDVSNSGISNTLGLTSFTNLVTLKINGNSLSGTLNLSGITTLKNIECQNNVLSVLTLDNPISVNASNNHLNTLNTDYQAPNLVYLNISNNYFGSFNIDYPSLVDFSANGNPMTQLYFAQASASGFVLNPITPLETLTFSTVWNSPAPFTVANFPNLKYITGGIEPSNGLVLENLPALVYANIYTPIKVTVKNINPSIGVNGLNFNINEFHLQGTSNTSMVSLQAVRAKKYYFEDLTSVTSLAFYVDEDATEVHFSNLPILNNLKFETSYSNPNACLTAVDLSTIPSLQNFEINNLRYSSMNFSNLNLLKKITMKGTSCDPSNSVLNITNLPQLEEITIRDRYLKTLTVSSLNSLKSIILNDSNCQSITLSSLPQLLSFFMDSNSNFNNTLPSLNFSNLPSLQSIELLKPYVSAVTFNNLPNLKTFKVEDPYSVYSSSDIATVYNFSNLPLLESIILNNSKVIPLTLSNLPSLKNLTMKRTFFGTNYTIQNLPLLQNINIEYAQLSGGPTVSLTDIGFNNLPAVKSITIKDLFHLNTLNFGNTNTSLENFSMLNEIATYGNLTSFAFNDFPQLKTLQFNRKLSNLQLTNLPQLHTLNVSSNNFTTLNIGNLPALQNFTSNYNLYTSGQYTINFTNLPALKKVDVSYNNGYLKRVDLSQAPQLEELHFIANNYGSPQTLDYINLKNGNPNMLVMDTEYIKNICVDNDSERALVQSLDTSLANTIFTSYCTLAPAGSIYKVTGTASYDYNNNGCDSSDPKFPYLKFGISTGGVSSVYTSNQAGVFSIPLQAGNHVITPILENPSYYNVSPTGFTANFPNQASPLIQNFCLTPNGIHNDLEVVIIPINGAAPGFTAKYKIIYKNKGNNTQSGTLSFNYNDNLMNYLTSSTVPASQSTGILNWNFTNLLPFETREIAVSFTLNTPTQTPALNGGDILHYTAQVNGATDETPADNIFTLNQTVVNSFDPNDKTCLEGSSITQTQIGEYVHYLIRFENKGTANAQNIVVKDEIDISKFDVSTLIPLNSSHNFVTRISNPNTVEFIFENIQLPYTTGNNGGYISFKIKTKSTLNIGDSFSNTAKIYFDYNFPIITNTYTTNVQTALGTTESRKESSTISIYPNPVKDVLNIQSKNEIVKAEIYDAAGRILISTSVKGNSINVSELTKGNYIIKLSAKDKTFTQKFIKN